MLNAAFMFVLFTTPWIVAFLLAGRGPAPSVTQMFCVMRAKDGR